MPLGDGPTASLGSRSAALHHHVVVGMNSDEQGSARVRRELRRWFRTPPRQHGEIWQDREVSFLELFYDLVYVVIIGQASHHLAAHVGWAGLRDFAVVFGLIWLAWFNGTLWHELHGREDGKSRSYIFVQMGLIALLAVFTGHATDDDGRAFALTYATLFALFTWQWFVVHRTDEDPQYRPATTRYLIGMIVSVAAMTTSAFMGDAGRLAIWAAMVVMWVLGGLLLMTTDRTAGVGEGVTASLVERFGLITIIVLGEVVIGVVTGMIDAPDRDARVIATGMLSLTIGMGLWWNYFDLLGRRVPNQRGGRLAGWMFVHLPMGMAIAAAGAAMVSLIEHSRDDRTPSATAWLLGGAVSVAVVGIALASRALPADEFPDGFQRHVGPALGTAAVACLAIATIRPGPIVLTGLISAVLAVAWAWLFAVYLSRGGTLRVEEPPHHGEHAT